MDAKQAKALREPFPASAIGKLPKPYKADSQRGNCQECGGYHGLPAAHLDYVGHAATTDRLLSVDPDWTWEPFAVDEQGLPALDRKGNLWIRLTVNGVTRIGVGDGKNAKECIGDAIRNAAMRFGVALDLWAKEDLHEISVGRNDGDVSRAAHDEPPPEPSRPGASEKQLALIGTLMSEQGMTDKPSALAYVADVIGRKVQSRNELTKAEASKLIERLQADAPKVERLQTTPADDPWLTEGAS